ncbi:hypothetical protein PVK06_032368 [Gossypium arboreum]|uniref:Beta-amylase n=1 Tax=Gossypium arboreum TaxID=29729 RepID=A0ABR0NTM2_GOSAR|nr:hypothetical protein PVK06_032368 [Gossypium arboreum]
MLKYNWEGYAELVRMVEKHGLKLQVVMSFHRYGGNVDSCSSQGKTTDLGLHRLHEELPEKEIQVGLGPCGELRYPESNGTWKFPGIGEFQCYDKYMRASLEAASEAIGKHDWGKAGPHDSGHYKQFPKETGFFQRDGAWKYRTPSTDSSSWSAFRKDSWNPLAYRTRSHAAELTAGYFNTRYQDGYLPIAQMFSKHGLVFIFTCMEMKDGEQPEYANCSPEGLARQVKMATKTAQVELAVENVLERYDAGGYAQALE